MSVQTDLDLFHSLKNIIFLVVGFLLCMFSLCGKVGSANLSQNHPIEQADAVNCRLTRSSGRGAVMSGNVVRIRLPRTAPRNPCNRISRPTVQPATATPSRFICFQTLGTPYTCMLACQTRLISGSSISSRFARVLRLDGSRSCAVWRR